MRADETAGPERKTWWWRQTTPVKLAVTLAVFVLCAAPFVGYELWQSHSKAEAAEAEVHDVLTAYAKNPADADAKYRGKHLKLYVPGVKMSRDGGDTIATHSPPYVTPRRHAQFWFVSEQEAAQLQPNKTYTITGRCDGLSGSVVVFRECVAVERQAPPK